MQFKAIIKEREKIKFEADDAYRGTSRRIAEVRASKPRFDFSTTDMRVQQHTEDIQHCANKAVQHFRGELSRQRRKATDILKLFKHQRGIDRDADEPDSVKTVIAIGLGALAEGLMAGIVFGLEGKMGPGEGILYGLVFSSVNVTLGAFIGFYVLRYLNVRFQEER
ncbi:MAG: hypothetical protein KDJ38_02335 [Gammaproteobacteria bacterium]|nr:hypothetical protein [Gammaproteobacteria bacterium]